MFKLPMLKKAKKTQQNIVDTVAASHLLQTFEEMYPIVDMKVLLEKAKEAKAEIYSFEQDWPTAALCFDISEADILPWKKEGDATYRAEVCIVVRGGIGAVFVAHRYCYEVQEVVARVFGSVRAVENCAVVESV